MKTKDYKGITLIALVITIIVLLILAGVSISMLAGDNGILTQAANASDNTDIANTKEQIELALIGYYDESGNYTISDVEQAVADSGATLSGKTVTTAKGNEFDISDIVNGSTSIVNPYDEEGWTIAYTCTDGVWSDAIEAGETAEGDIIAKFYATENTITPSDLYWKDTDTTYTFSEGTEYYLVIEGKGSMPELIENDGTSLTAAYAWHTETAMLMLGYANTCIMPYVTEITVCDGITNIGNFAFAASISLNNITIGNTVTSIDYWAFGCSGLTSIIIPNSVTSIGRSAFVYSELSAVTLPKSITMIGAYAFGYNTSLSEITYKGTKVDWEAIEKAVSWKNYSNITKIICTDGEI